MYLNTSVENSFFSDRRVLAQSINNDACSKLNDSVQSRPQGLNDSVFSECRGIFFDQGQSNYTFDLESSMNAGRLR